MVFATVFGVSYRFQKFNPIKSFPASETASLFEDVVDGDELQDFAGIDVVPTPHHHISLQSIKIICLNLSASFSSQQINFFSLPRSPPSV